MKKYDTTGVIIGRWQIDDLHIGHKGLIQSVLDKHTKVIIFIGVSKALGSFKNPLDYATREMMIRSHYPSVIVLPLPDMKSDYEWSKNLDSLIKIVSPVGKVCLYGSRDSFIPFYKGKNLTKEIDTSIETSATDRRTELSLHTRESKEFRMGAIYHSFQQYPKVMLAVDAAIIRGVPGSLEILLGMKPNESEWRFPGGMVDPTDKSSEDAVIREVQEETGLIVKNPKYVCNQIIDDWRYESEPDKIASNFYTVELVDSKQQAIADDDLSKGVKWFPISGLDEVPIVSEHRKLITILLASFIRS